MDAVMSGAQGNRISQGNGGVRIQDRDKFSVIARHVNMLVVPEELNDLYLSHRAKARVVDRAFPQVFRSYADHNVISVTLAKNV